MSIKDFLSDLEKSDSKIKNYFNNITLLKSSLIELDNVIGMQGVKSQIIKQIKTYISTKAKGIYSESDRKHCLLCGPPGCGKTTVGKILCKIWVAIGFIGRNSSGVPKKVTTFNKVQDELIRSQRQNIRDYKKI
jgi:SpoVK/Ycf46/Vps4 family AAA+-type ATPase